MNVSIIIAVKKFNPNLKNCLEKCLALDYSYFEIIVLPDKEFVSSDPKVKIIPTGNLTAPQKRDIGAKLSSGDILAFIDDDAYPRSDWLKNAVKQFQALKIAALGGPGLTPQEDSPLEKASGKIYESILVSSHYTYRYLQKKQRPVEDYPSCNFFIKKSIFQEAGGFDTKFWPGEDTKLCLDITKRLKQKIIYDPDVVVYHHRRKVFFPHLKQISNYALHRGYFAKRYPETSLKLAYFVPSLFLVSIIAGPLFFHFIPHLKMLYWVLLLIYLVTVAIFSISREIALIPIVFFGIITTHITYGFYFLKGLFTRRLKEERENNNILSTA